MDKSNGSGASNDDNVSNNIISKAYELTGNNKKRREAQRESIAADHEKRIKATKTQVQSLFNDRKTRVTKSQRVLWTRLHELNKRREDVESEILAIMKNIEKETQNIQGEISAVLAGRISDIGESMSKDGD